SSNGNHDSYDADGEGEALPAPLRWPHRRDLLMLLFRGFVEALRTHCRTSHGASGRLRTTSNLWSPLSTARSQVLRVLGWTTGPEPPRVTYVDQEVRHQ